MDLALVSIFSRSVTILTNTGVLLRGSFTVPTHYDTVNPAFGLINSGTCAETSTPTEKWTWSIKTPAATRRASGQGDLLLLTTPAADLLQLPFFFFHRGPLYAVRRSRW